MVRQDRASWLCLPRLLRSASVFEIGNSLREARLRQELDLLRAESDTKIRGRYLQALEDEQFEVLPGDTYVKGFLRTYADYLGLDAQLYVDEYNSRFAPSDDPPIASRSAPSRRRRRAESSAVVVALAGIVAVTALVVVAWQLRTGDSDGSEQASAPAARPATSPPAVPPAETAAAGSEQQPVTVVLNAIRGNTWLAVRAGSAAGELLFQGTLEKGQTQRFVRKRVWLQYGAGNHLELKVNGEQTDVPAGAAIVAVGPKGVKVVSTG